jgi:hypothetical protein
MLAGLEAESTPFLPEYGYNVAMRTRKQRLLSRASSPLVVLCLLTAPLCATRCTLSCCVQANTHQQSAPGCHHQSAHPHGSCTLAAASALSCLPTDLFLTALPMQQTRLLPTSSDHNSRLLSVIPNPRSFSGVSVPIRFRIADRDSSHGDSASFVSNPPLRL